MANKIHVLQATGSLRVGGLETVALNIFRYCDKTKYSFDYLVYGDAIEPLESVVEELGGRVFHIPYPHVDVNKYMREMKKIMYEYGPYHVVHAHSLFNSGLVMKAAYEMKIPIRIAHAHSDRRNTEVGLPRRCYNLLMQKLINRYATQKIACSEGAGKYLYGKAYDNSIYIMRNGVDVKRFRFNQDKRNEIKEEFGWSKCKIVGHVGRLSEVKNQKKIINVFNCAYLQDPSLRLIIAGDGELKDVLQRQIDALGLTGVVRLTGTRNDVPALLSAFDVYIMPSLYEGVSISLIEAQASGVHCLVSSNAASPETRLTDCINIMELSESDTMWSNKLLELLGKKRDGKSFETIIEKGYNSPDIVKDMLQLYEGNR